MYGQSDQYGAPTLRNPVAFDLLSDAFGAIDATYAIDKSTGLCPTANPDRVRLSDNAFICDIDVTVTGCSKNPGPVPKSGVDVARGVVLERFVPTGGVVVALRVGEERIEPGGGVVVARGVVLERSCPTGGV